MKQELSIDIETYSSVNLKTSGVNKYVESSDFEILLMAYAFGDEEPQIVELVNAQEWPIEHEEVYWAITDKSYTKTAYNANFEMRCLKKKWFKDLQEDQWQCTQVKSVMLGLPSGLFATGMAMRLDTRKDEAGKDYIKMFCVPQKPKKNDKRTRLYPHDNPEAWEGFKKYCIGDVIQERKVRQGLPPFTISSTEEQLFALDYRINSRGILVDKTLAENAIKISALYQSDCLQEARELTGISNPKSNAQIKDWLEESLDMEIETLNKKAMPKLLSDISDETALKLLELRKQFSKTSIKKYDAMLRYACSDDRARGLLQYLGAGRTGRWAGRGIQIQNLVRNSMKQLELAREVVRGGDYEELSMLWPNVSDVLSELIRTGFISKPEHSLASSDFSSIEARITAWLAKEKWRLDVFSSHGKIYEASASQMFKVPLDTVMKGGANYNLRQNGKVSELSLGFGGGPQALINMGALNMQFIKDLIERVKKTWDEEAGLLGWLVIGQGDKAVVFENFDQWKDYWVMKELAKIVKMWRQASPNIVKLWNEFEECAIYALQAEGQSFYASDKRIRFEYKYKRLWIWLPSGRPLVYLNPKLIPGKFEHSLQIVYENMNQTTKKFTTTSTYGGKLCENIVQAIARDLLGEAMLRLDKAGFSIVGHVHDEVIMEEPDATLASNVIKINKIMAEQPAWAKGLPLGAETTISKFYRKTD